MLLLLGKNLLTSYGGYNQSKAKLLSRGHFVKKLWMLRGVEVGMKGPLVTNPGLSRTY